MKVGLLDPNLYKKERFSPNIGDAIISRASFRELRKIFGEDVEVSSYSSHSFRTLSDVRELNRCDYIFLGGSNALWFRFFPPASWPLGPIELFMLNKVVCMGAGWGGYEIAADKYSRWASDKVFERNILHSVRDGYTKKIMEAGLDFKNVLNTGCHTTWSLDTGQKYNRSKGDKCVFSLTDYKKDIQADSLLIKSLKKLYDGNLLFWPQGKGDLSYVKSLGYQGDILEPKLENLIRVYETEKNLDYIGTRLHAGILAIEFGVRTIVIEVDNRAKEIALDIALPTVSRNDCEKLEALISSEWNLNLNRNDAAISQWRAQFI